MIASNRHFITDKLYNTSEPYMLYMYNMCVCVHVWGSNGQRYVRLTGSFFYFFFI